MPGPNQIPDHVQRMGTLVVNLQSLEFALRGFLYNCETGWTNQGGPSFLENIAKGRQLEVNAFTNYDTLAKLIDKYNSQVRPRYPDLAVDPGIARIRDALAHGRIAGLLPSPNEPLRLVKYSQPANRVVCVTDFHILTKNWFDEKSESVAQSGQKVLRAITLFQSAS